MPRALIVKLGAIGDVVMAIPAAHALHQQGYKVDWICGTTVAPVLRLYPWMNVLPVDERKLLHSGKLSTTRVLLAAWKQLPHRTYDLCATLYYDRRYRFLTLPISAQRSILLSDKDREHRLLPGRHHTDEYVRILLGLPDGEAPQQTSPVRVGSLPASPLPSPNNRQRVVLVPGGARNLLRDDALRRWPLDNYAALATQLLADGCEVVLAGGPDDAWTSPAFATMPVIDLIGKLSLVDTLALLDSADVTVTHDTGPLHLAGITRTAIVTIFGPTDPRGRLPQVHNAVALWGGEGFACRPCYDGHSYAPCQHNGCMEQVTPEFAFAETQHLLLAVANGLRLAPRVVNPIHTPLITLPSGAPTP